MSNTTTNPIETGTTQENTMSLDWNIANVEDRHLLHNTATEKDGPRPFPEGSAEDKQGDIEWEITNSLIWATMAVGLSSITKANWMKFAARVHAMEKVNGARLCKGGEPFPITPAMVHRRIGLSTNASTLTDAKFERKLGDALMRDAHNQVRKFERTLTQQEVEA